MKTERFALMLSPEMVAEVSEYRHSNKIGSLAEAMRRLISEGLKAETKTATSEPASSN